MDLPKPGDLYKQCGTNWRVVDTVAGIITLRNGKGEERNIYPSQLKDYKSS